MGVSNSFDNNKNSNSVLLLLENIKTNIQNKYNYILKTNKSSCPKLQSALEYVLSSNSKYIRSALIYSIADNKTENNLLINSSTAIELIHTYSLVHDDLPAMDNDDLRRGKPTCHKQFNEATAVLVGDCLQTMAYQLLSEEMNNSNLLYKQLKIINILTKATNQLGMIAGQSLDLNNINNIQVDINILNQIHLLKTAKLITASLQIGAIITGLDQDIEKYRLIIKLGEILGLAFQIQDDILDYTQTSETLGKPALSDQNRGLPTYPSLIGLDKSISLLDQYWAQCTDITNKLNINITTLSLLMNYIKGRTH